MKFLACSLLLLASALGEPGRKLDAAKEPALADWTYRSTGPAGVEPYKPTEWSKGYPDCGLMRQSPINFAADIEEVVSDYKLEFTQSFCDSSDLSFTSDYAVWKVDYSGCAKVPSLMWQGEKYNLLQFHIHAPSEHTIAGAEADACIHMVHVKAGTDDVLLVVGVLFDVSEYSSNLELEKLWSILGLGQATTKAKFTSAVYDLLPADPSFMHYMGSLTTPPCTQGVTWIVMNEVSTIGKDQLDTYRDSVASFPGSKVSEFGNTNRPVQPLNGRPLVYVPA